MADIQLPAFATVNRWQEAETEDARARLIATSRRKAQMARIKTIAITAVVTFTGCALLNGAEAMPAVVIQIWGH